MLDKPEYPDWDDDHEFDVVVIGSGAGGAVVASKVLEAGHSCLVIESGDWVPPADCAQMGFENGKEVVYAPKTEEMLRKTYMKSGANPAGKILERLTPRDVLRELATLIPDGSNLGKPVIEKTVKVAPLKPGQIVNFVQGNVVGGGPYINNAIHLPIQPEVWEEWGDYRPKLGDGRMTYDELKKRMCEVEKKLGVSAVPTDTCIGDDADLFMLGVRALNKKPVAMPVSIDEPIMDQLKEQTCFCDEQVDDEDCPPKKPEKPYTCVGGGSDNWVDPLGRHTGGLHPWRENNVNSYMMDIVKHGADNRKNHVAYQTRAVRFEVEASPDGETRNVSHLIVEDRHCGRVNRRKIRAKKFVLAAGAYASTHILMATPYLKRLPHLGTRLTGNVGSPLIAIFGKPVRKEDSERPYPGIAQCVMVREDPKEETPLLENWFGLPGMVALSAGGWFGASTKVMNNLRNLAICGVAVPTDVRDDNKINRKGKANLELSDHEFDLYINGLRLIGKIFLEAAKQRNDTVELVFPTKAAILDESTNEPLRITDEATLERALKYISHPDRRVPFLNIITSHPQGGNSLGFVVDQDTFKVKTTDNLYVADASIYPEPCKINPQLTLKALALLAAEKLIDELSGNEGQKNAVV